MKSLIEGMQKTMEAVSKKQSATQIGPLKFKVSRDGSRIADPHKDIMVVIEKHTHLKGLWIEIYDYKTEEGENSESSLTVVFDGDDWDKAEEHAKKVLSRYMKTRKVQSRDPWPQFYTL
jgi:hypothetical protein